jgi:hypothetical protein
LNGKKKKLIKKSGTCEKRDSKKKNWKNAGTMEAGLFIHQDTHSLIASRCYVDPE